MLLQQEACTALSLPIDSPLRLLYVLSSDSLLIMLTARVDTGLESMPKLAKAWGVVQASRKDADFYQSATELPVWYTWIQQPCITCHSRQVEINLPARHCFHSLLVCPVLKFVRLARIGTRDSRVTGRQPHLTTHPCVYHAVTC